MNKRPLSVTIIGCVYILTGVGGLVSHFSDFKAPNPFQFDIIGVAFVRLIAVVCGVYMLRGQNWARWVALAWIAFHVIVSALHTLRELSMHILICAILAYFLFRPVAARYFGPGLEV
jgi:hypothetical protein